MSPTLDPKLARLVCYLDGELDDASRAEFESELATDAALSDELERMIRLRDLLDAAPAAFALPDPGELAFERVRQSIHAATWDVATAPTAAPAVVVPISRARSYRGWAVGGAVLVAAAAAVAVVMVRPWSDAPSVAHRGTSGENGDHNRTAQSNPMNGTEIVRVEFGKMSGTYWEQADGADRVAVVWIDDSVLGEVGRP